LQPKLASVTSQSPDSDRHDDVTSQVPTTDPPQDVPPGQLDVPPVPPVAADPPEPGVPPVAPPRLLEPLQPPSVKEASAKKPAKKPTSPTSLFRIGPQDYLSDGGGFVH
jgi:hypothetical protein